MADKLVRKRGYIKAALTKLMKTAQQELAKKPLEKFTLEKSLRLIREKKKILDEENDKIADLLEDDLFEQEMEETMEYTSRIDEICVELEMCLKIGKAESLSPESLSLNLSQMQNESTHSVTKKNKSAIRLPKFELTKFDGSLDKWMEFWRCFELSIDKNEDIDKGLKLVYLKSYLTGTAAGVVSGLDLTDDDYDEAIDRLKKRFGRTNLLLNTHMNALMNVTPIYRVSDVEKLRKLYDNLCYHLRSLKSMGVSLETFNVVAGQSALRAIPDSLRMEYSRKHKEDQTLENLLEFLKDELEVREDNLHFRPNKTTEFDTNGRSHHTENGRYQKTASAETMRYKKFSNNERVSTAAALAASVKSDECLFCKETSHTSPNCPLDVTKRKEVCRKYGHCFRCLKTQHLSRDCPSGNRCKKCPRTHHTWICDTEKQTGEAKVNAISKSRATESTIMLQIIMVDVVGHNQQKRVRCFLDSGSEGTFVSKKLIEQLGLPTIKKGKLKVQTFNHQEPNCIDRRIATLHLVHPHNEQVQTEVKAMEVPFITQIAQRTPTASIQNKLHQIGIELNTGDEAVTDDEVHILIGMDNYWRIAMGRVEKITDDLKAMQTVFGWTLSGRIDHEQGNGNTIATMGMHHVMIREDTNDILKKFWELEAIGITDSTKANEDDSAKAVNLFDKSITYKENYYNVRLPWSREPDELDDNRQVALRRFWNLIRRFKSDKQLYTQYKEVIEKQLEEGILEGVNENKETKNATYYVPHAPVIKEDRLTTKLRIVCDASSHAKGCLSLNECLFKGPNDLPQIVNLLNTFRCEKWTLVADIKQAFHRIKVQEEDRDVMRIFWMQPNWNRHDRCQLHVLRFTRVMFGTTASPFLLSATVKHHLEQNKVEYPITCERLSKRMYVDDYVDSVKNIEMAEKLYTEAKELMKKANMNLVKWRTNSTELQKKIDIKEGVNIEMHTEAIKVLGIRWNVISDVIELDLNEVIDRAAKHTTTKRELIKTAATLYDPLGMAEPFLITAKILFQETWVAKTGWEEDLPHEIQTRWNVWRKQVPTLQEIQRPRRVLANGSHRQLHFFCDASAKAYGVAAYIKSGEKKHQVQLCLAKSRVAPLKELTIPKLELMATVLAARLVKNLQEIYETKDVHFWTDSEIALCWIRDNRRKQKPFIENRVQEIRQNTQIQDWKHCPGTDNPADLLTRGIEAKKLVSNRQWWHGPLWLQMEERTWPQNNGQPSHNNEELNTIKCSVIQLKPIIPFERFGSWMKLVRTVAWMYRFINQTKKKNHVAGCLKTEEIKSAQITIICMAQRERFSDVLQQLKNKKEIDKSSLFGNFPVELNPEEIITVKRRIQNSDLEEGAKSPMVIPHNHHVANLLIRYHHDKTIHGGVAQTLSSIRENYWIPRARQLIKKIIKTCIICQKIHKRLMSETSGQLPPDRITRSHPFGITGVDFAGPLYTRDSAKVYVALFTCAVTRAIHLELVSDLSTEKFILAFKRFMGRRAIPLKMYSDNARTFKRAERELKTFLNDLKGHRFGDFLTNNNIQWKYIVEHAPWWGGFWERMVRTVKTSLKKTLGKAHVNYEELSTILVEIESIVNARPLTYVYENPNEPEPLTPSHFLMGAQMNLMPSTDASNSSFSKIENITIRKTWRRRQKLVDQYWQRWSHEYLTELRGCQMRGNKIKLKEGDLVLIEDLNRARWQWRIGRISEIFVGRDGKTRSCAIKLPDCTIIKRPVQRLCPFEMDGAERPRECKN